MKSNLRQLVFLFPDDGFSRNPPEIREIGNLLVKKGYTVHDHLLTILITPEEGRNFPRMALRRLIKRKFNLSVDFIELELCEQDMGCPQRL